MSWDKNLLNLEKNIISDLQLRFNFPILYISTLSSMLYCEKKVEFEILLQPEPTDAQILGSQLHESAIIMEEAKLVDIIKSIKSGKTTITSFSLKFKFKRVIIGGIPDAIIFIDRTPKYLIEIKTSKNPVNIGTLFDQELFQAYLYAIALEELGFQIDDLKIIIPKIVQDVDKSKIENVLPDILLEKIENQISENQMRIHKINYNAVTKAQILQTLDNLIKYWKLDRTAKGSDIVIKCKYCQFSNHCNLSLDKLNL
jgi:CRISPR/Cas system-associated exonuclease Cas4 (RecB family)